MTKYYLLFLCCFICLHSIAQNVGIGITTPTGKLHIKGNADTSQLVIDAHTIQNNTRPLLKFRNANGVDILGLHTDSEYNLFVGVNAGRTNLPNLINGNGLYNTFIGSGSGYYNSSGFSNTALGRNSLFQNTSGNDNTSVGFKSLFSNTDGRANTAVGSESLLSNISGLDNTATGSNALEFNVTGSDNTAAGAYSLHQNSSASGNVALGHFALRSQSYSPGYSWYSYNTAVGINALQFNQPNSSTNGIKNTAVGASALNSNTIGFHNTALGASALFSNTAASENSAVGTDALKNNISGSSNTSIGYRSMASNVDAYDNTAAGSYSLYNNTSGSQNTAVGKGSLGDNVNGHSNTAIGNQAIFFNNSGDYNTAVGYQALYKSLTGDHNTAVGRSALANLTGGYQNIAIGWGSGTHAAAPNVYNTISIGNDGFLNAYQNQAFIGNVSTAWIGGQVNWSTYSDARIKNNITEDVKGLDFITRLRPVTYNKNFDAITTVTGNAETENFQGKYDGEKIKYSGFLAQDVEAAAKQSNYNFSGLHKPKGEFDLYSLSYAEFVVPLVKAVQEQQMLINNQQMEIENKQKQIDELKARLDKIENLIIK